MWKQLKPLYFLHRASQMSSYVLDHEQIPSFSTLRPFHHFGRGSSWSHQSIKLFLCDSRNFVAHLYFFASCNHAFRFLLLMSGLHSCGIASILLPSTVGAIIIWSLAEFVGLPTYPLSYFMWKYDNKYIQFVRCCYSGFFCDILSLRVKMYLWLKLYAVPFFLSGQTYKISKGSNNYSSHCIQYIYIF